MNKILKISIALNLLILFGAAYLVINGKGHIKQYLVKHVLDIHYEQKLSMFRACPADSGAIIFVGNSITEGGNWAELFTNKNILNRGIGGDITAGVLSRMDEITRHRPTKVFICIGTNDLARGIDIPAIMKDYNKIIAHIRNASPATTVYVQSVLPVGSNCIYGHKNQPILELNKEIRSMCQDLGITYIDLHAHFSDENGELISSYTNDDLHLTGNAYLVWKDLIQAYIDEN